MKICVLSDSHDNLSTLKEITQIIIKERVDCILHCGDIVSPHTLEVIIKADIPLHVIHGNNKCDLTILTQMSANPSNKIKYYGKDASINLADKQIFLVHYPDYAEKVALTGEYDLVCCGHSHHANIHCITNRKQTKTMIINPGNTAGIGEKPHFVIGSLNTMEFKIKSLR